MRYILTISLLFCLTTLFGQTNWRDNRLPTDTCIKIANGIPKNYVGKQIHSNPLIVANGIVIRGQELDTTLLQDISLLKCPDAFNEFGYAGANGALIIKTKQSFKTVTAFSTRQKKSIEGNVVYALNGFLLSDTTILISKKAITNIQILSIDSKTNNDEKVTCINIWTMTKKDRKPLAALCRGIRVSSAKVD